MQKSPRKRQNKRLGWKRQLPDNRDLRYSVKKKAIDLPSKVSLKRRLADPYDQGNLGSCTANAIAAALDFDERLQHKRGIKPSRLFIYYCEREIEGTVSEDAGAEIRDGIKVVNKLGVCHETLWPYKINMFTTRPKDKCYTEAVKYKAMTYEAVSQNEHDIKDALAAGRPVIFGFTVYDNFYNIDKSGLLSMPSGGVLGGHAVIAVGYDDKKRLFTIQNSWGKDWGDKGFFYMPYDYLLNGNLCDDFWVINTVV